MYSSFVSGKKFIHKNNLICDVFFKGKKIISGAFLEFEYPTDRPGRIEGDITVGNEYKAEVDEILGESVELKPAEMSENISNDNVGIEFYTKEAHLDYAHWQDLNIPTSNLHIHAYIEEFTKHYMQESGGTFLEEFSKPFPLRVQSVAPRRINFLITGPYELWSKLNFLSFEKYTVKIIYGELREHDIIDKDELLIRKGRYYLQVTELGDQTQSSEDFIKNSVKLINDLLILASFLSKASITWWSYTYFNGNSIRDYVKSMYNENLSFKNYATLLFEPSKCKELIEDKLKYFVKLNNENFNLTTPILEFISHYYLTHTTQIFTVIYIALEKLCHDFAERENIRLIDSKKKTYTTLRRRVTKYIDELDANSIAKENIKSKIPELNNTPFQVLFRRMFDYYKVRLNDTLFSDEEKTKFKFISVRNYLFHGNMRTLSSKEIFNTTKDIENLFINLILRILDSDLKYQKDYFHL